MKTKPEIFQKKIDRIAIGSKVNNEAAEISKTISSLKAIKKSLAGTTPVQVLALERLIDNLVIVQGNLKDVFSEMNGIQIHNVPVKAKKSKLKLTEVTKTNQKIKPASTKLLKRGETW